VRIEASRAGPKILLVVTNPYDPDVRRKGTGFGMDIVRRRLAATFADRAAMTVEAQGAQYRVALTVPVEPPGGQTA
jgi:LytS/YehU family sensor histidine kinase